MSELHQLLERSHELDETLLNLLLDSHCDSNDRIQASRVSCNIAWEHGLSVRTLIASELATTGTAVMRLQFEALVRAIWLAYAASEEDVALVRAPLSKDNEQAARNLPSATEMLRLMNGKAPDGAVQMLDAFKKVSWHALNSYVHGGLHPLRRQDEGYPVPLLMQVVRNSNALITMTAMLLANTSGDERIAKSVSKVQRVFADCLPDPQ